MPTTTPTTSYIIKQHRRAQRLQGMDKPSSAYATHGRALKRHQNKGAKPGYKQRLQIYYKTAKSLKKVLTSGIIKSQKRKRG